MRGFTVAMPDPFQNRIFDMKITLGSLVVIVVGIMSISGASWAAAIWTNNVTTRISALEEQISHLTQTVGDIDRKLNRWHFTDPEKHTEVAPPP